MSASRGFRSLGWAPITVPGMFLTVFFIFPVLYLLWISIHEPSSTDFYGPRMTVENYARILGDPFYQTMILRTLWAGIIIVGACLFIGYPMALVLMLLPKRWRMLAMALLLFPLMLSNVIRAYGWIAILGRRGALNATLAEIGLIERPLEMLYTFEAVTVGLLTILLPYVIVAILNSLSSVDKRQLEAAQALGAGPLRTFVKVTWPLTAPGVTSGLMIVFLLMLSAYVTITLLGGARLKLLVSLIYDASMTFEWPLAAALAFVLLGLGLFGSAVILACLRPDRVQGRR